MITDRMKPAACAAVARDVAGMHAAIERFLKASQQPYLLEPGEELLPLKEGSYSVDLKEARLTIQAWSDTRNLTRRIVGLVEERRGRLELVVEHFARSVGPMFLIDMSRPDSIRNMGPTLRAKCRAHVPDRYVAPRFAGSRTPRRPAGVS